MTRLNTPAVLLIGLSIICVGGPALAAQDNGDAAQNNAGSLWGKTLGGLKLGQSCPSAHHTFPALKWKFGSGYGISKPNLNLDATYSRPGESVSFHCVKTINGMAVAQIIYGASGPLLSQQEFVQLLTDKFGPPAVQYNDLMRRAVYGWGDVSQPDQNGNQPTPAQARVLLIYDNRYGGRADFNAGAAWLTEKTREVQAAGRSQLRATVKPSL